jgi:hypothetical protein
MGDRNEEKQSDPYRNLTFKEKPQEKIVTKANGFAQIVIWLAQSDDVSAKRLRWLGTFSFVVAIIVVKLFAR